jgi:hypothetical protein
MSVFQLILGNKPKGFVPPDKTGTGVIGLELDATILESPQFTATATRSDVETGVDITDHVELDPQQLSIQGIVSNTPVSFLGGLIISGDPAQDALNFLLDLYRNREPFDFVGGLQVYSNMVITSFNPSRTPQTGKALQFTMTMQQIRIVDSEVVEAVNFDEDVEHSAGDSQSLGTQSTEAATAKSVQQSESVLLRWFPNLLGG